MSTGVQAELVICDAGYVQILQPGGYTGNEAYSLDGIPFGPTPEQRQPERRLGFGTLVSSRMDEVAERPVPRATVFRQTAVANGRSDISPLEPRATAASAKP